MHDQNPFKNGYDLTILATLNSTLKKAIYTNKYGNTTIDFSDASAVKALNQALLKSQYNLDWDLPKENLCPPIPGRLEYLLHIADLVQKKDVQLLDIGTGASLIYPVLGTAHFNWKCAGSETERTSIEHAKKIIKHNSKLSSIDIRSQKNKHYILKGIVKEKDAFDVMVCNPPFFKNKAEATKQNRRKTNHLKSARQGRNFSGVANELWYPGGESQFIETLISESILYKKQINWFTTLIANEDHLKRLIKRIKKTKPKALKIIPLILGNKESRILAWCFN